MKTSLETQPPAPELPVEVILQIVGHIARADPSEQWRSNIQLRSTDPQRTLWACSLVNWTWHSASVAELYRHPALTSKNYDLFVRTICPSVNIHIKKTDLASLVRVLDLHQLVFAGSKSFVARLLGRIKGQVEVLRAPQTSFAINSLAALSKCHRLHTLDMSLVTESIPVLDFFRTIEKITSLARLSLPRSSLSLPNNDAVLHNSWPPNLGWLTIPANTVAMLIEHGPRDELHLDVLVHSLTRPHELDELQRLVNRVTRVNRIRLDAIASLSSSWDDGLAILHLSYYLISDMCRTVTSVELHGFGDVDILLDNLQDFFNESPEDCPLLRELVIGPINGSLLSNTYHEALTRQYGPGRRAFGAYEVPFWAPLTRLRRIFLWSTNDDPSRANEGVEYLSDLLVQAEVDRVANSSRNGNGDGYGYGYGNDDNDSNQLPQECGILLFRRGPYEDMDAAMARASPPPGLAARFGAAATATWPHAHNPPWTAHHLLA